MAMRTSRMLAATGLVAALAMSCASAEAQTQRLRGTIERVDGNTLFVKTRDGAAITLKLADNVTITAVHKATRADIKAGAVFSGVAANKQADGTFTAARINVGRDGGVPN